MAVIDLWRGRDGKPTARDGRGRRYRVEVPGHPTKSFHAKRDAQQWERELHARPHSFGDTVGGLVDLWLAGKVGLSQGGYDQCRRAADRVRAAWGDAMPHELERAELQAWVAGLMVTSKTKGADPPPCLPYGEGKGGAVCRGRDADRDGARAAEGRSDRQPPGREAVEA